MLIDPVYDASLGEDYTRFKVEEVLLRELRDRFPAGAIPPELSRIFILNLPLYRLRCTVGGLNFDLGVRGTECYWTSKELAQGFLDALQPNRPVPTGEQTEPIAPLIQVDTAAMPEGCFIVTRGETETVGLCVPHAIPTRLIEGRWEHWAETLSAATARATLGDLLSDFRDRLWI